MAETKQDIRAQLRYMRDNKETYLTEPNAISEDEYNQRIEALQAQLTQ